MEWKLCTYGASTNFYLLMEKSNNSTFRLSVATLAIMNVTAVVSLRGLAAESVYGLGSAFYYLFAAFVFLIPTALVAAELAAMFSDKEGGVFRWIGEAFGARTGFLAIWLQWIQSTIWYPTVLTFGAVSIAFIGMAVPHIVRGMFRTSDHRIVLPACIIVGASLLTLCDIISQMPWSDAVLPINSVSSLIGAPIILWVIFKNKHLHS